MHCKICGIGNCEKIKDYHHLMAFSTQEDINGFFHYHDKNARWNEWKCRQGHEFRFQAYNSCWCGWTSQYPDLNKCEFKPEESTVGVKFGTGFKKI